MHSCFLVGCEVLADDMGVGYDFWIEIFVDILRLDHIEDGCEEGSPALNMWWSELVARLASRSVCM